MSSWYMKVLVPPLAAMYPGMDCLSRVVTIGKATDVAPPYRLPGLTITPLWGGMV